MKLVLHTDSPYIQHAIRLCGEETISKLNEFYQATTKLEIEYRPHAQALTKAVLAQSVSADTKKKVTALLLELGFKNSNVSKMINAVIFQKALEESKSDAATWVQSLPISTAYELSLCDDQTFNKIWVEESEWGAKPVGRDKVVSVKEKVKQKVSRENIVTQQPVEEFSMEKNTPTSPKVSRENNLLKALELVADYPDIVALIKTKLHIN